MGENKHLKSDSIIELIMYRTYSSRVLWRVARILFITYQVSCSCTRDEGFSCSEVGLCLWEFKRPTEWKLRDLGTGLSGYG